MMDPHEFAQKQLELTAEFGKYVIDHPEADDALPPESHIYFEVAGEEEFNRYSRQLAEKQLGEEGLPLVCIRIKGRTPAVPAYSTARPASPARWRLIDPVIEPVPAVA